MNKKWIVLSSLGGVIIILGLIIWVNRIPPGYEDLPVSQTYDPQPQNINPQGTAYDPQLPADVNLQDSNIGAPSSTRPRQLVPSFQSQ